MQGEFFGKKVLVAGQGVSGEGAMLALRGEGAECAYFTEGEQPFVPDCIVVSPGIDVSKPPFSYAMRHGIPVIGELELGFRLCKVPVAAITGTNGKTTVTRLLGQILQNAGKRVAVCGNVGSSFARAAAQNEADIAVVEVSSFQLETAETFRPHVAIVTNIAPDHLDRHGDMQTYAACKRKIAAKQTESDYLILSQDDIPLWALENFLPRATTLFTSVRGKLRGAYVLHDRIYYCGEEICACDRVRMEGEHNLKNALSAVCAAKALGVQNAPIVDALTTFLPDAHRLHLVARKQGKNYYNDSKGTNIAATLCAARAMQGDTCLMVGGSDKGYEYDELFASLPPQVVRIAAMGETAPKVQAAAARAGFTEICAFSDFTQAFLWAKEGREENVLLSPASASFDMFSSYVERGEAFERLVLHA